MYCRLIALIATMGMGFWLVGCSTPRQAGSTLQESGIRVAPPAKTAGATDTAGIIDDFSRTQQTWKVEGWANPATLTLEKGTLKIDLQPGKADKVTVSCQVNTYLSNPRRIMLDVDNQTGSEISVAIAVATGKAPTYFESPPVKVKSGLVRNVAFDLGSDRFKAASTQWTHSAKVTEINALRLVYVVIYNSGSGTVYLDNLRAVAR